jgi:hypothetical protein
MAGRRRLSEKAPACILYFDSSTSAGSKRVADPSCRHGAAASGQQYCAQVRARILYWTCGRTWHCRIQQNRTREPLVGCCSHLTFPLLLELPPQEAALASNDAVQSLDRLSHCCMHAQLAPLTVHWYAVEQHEASISCQLASRHTGFAQQVSSSHLIYRGPLYATVATVAL